MCNGLCQPMCSAFDTKLSRWLTLWRLTTHIGVVPHRSPLNVAFYIFIQQIYVLNILNTVYTLRFFFLSKCSLFHNYNVFGSCIIHILYTGCAKKLKKKIRRQEVTVCRKNITNRIDEKKKKKYLQKNDNWNTAHLSSLPPTLLRLIFTPFSPETSQTKQQT